jgi:hypothetical protein
LSFTKASALVVGLVFKIFGAMSENTYVSGDQSVIDTCYKCDPSATHKCDPYVTNEIRSKCDPMINAEQRRKEATVECFCFIIINWSLFPSFPSSIIIIATIPNGTNMVCTDRPAACMGADRVNETIH